MADIQIEVRESGHGSRQIANPKTITEALASRAGDIEEAISEAIAMGTRGIRHSTEKGWSAASIELTFGIKLIAESGVVIAKAGGEASMEVKISIERTRDDS